SDLAVKSRLPVTYHRREYVEAGGLMSYSVNFLDLDRRAAYYLINSKRRQTGRLASRAADQVRASHQSENRQADRPDHSAKRVGQSRQSNPMTERSKIKKWKIQNGWFPPYVLARADRVIR
ncbi:MAG: hypothetical protein K0Q83_3654, partial [Deltaproteobacteria bacterium]|nr:hypothetical protein [Deltaproteobacteria bacterium]